MASLDPNHGVPVYDPRGLMAAEFRPLAPRVPRLDGLRLAVLDNTKWNANKLLRMSVVHLGAQYRFLAVNHYRKETFSRVAAPALIAEIVAHNDVVLTAIGD
jgi:hypothetical protein